MKMAYVCVIGRCMWDCTGMRQLDQKGRNALSWRGKPAHDGAPLSASNFLKESLSVCASSDEKDSQSKNEFGWRTSPDDPDKQVLIG